MRHCIKLVLLLCLLSGCGDDTNQVIDTTNRPTPPDAKEMEEYNAAMEAAAKEGMTP